MNVNNKRKERRKKRHFLLILLTVLLVVPVLGGCEGVEREEVEREDVERERFEYTGRYPELYTAVLHAVPGIWGYITGNILGGEQPNIRRQNWDSFGRVVVRYDEDSPLIRGRAYVVVQKVEGDYVYFYPFYNHIVAPSRLGDFPLAEELERLRKANSWEQELSDDSEFVRVRITRFIERGPIPDSVFVQAYREIFPETTCRDLQIMGSTTFLRTDSYGRALYFSVGSEGTGEERVRHHVVVLFQPDGSFDLETGVVFFKDFYRYQTQLREFMEANGWDTPFEE